jgi:acyl-CoA reductase-like NAD-dependent aldehyde dehydrogenase
LLITSDNHVNREYIGKDAAFILDAIGIRVPQSTRLVICDVAEDHPFVQHELLMPVMGMVRCPTVDAAIDCAVRVEHGFGHTASMWSTNLDNLHAMARACNTSIFVKNAPNYAGLGEGGEGYTSFTIASPTGEGLTTAVSFSRIRRCTLKDRFRIV